MHLGEDRREGAGLEELVETALLTIINFQTLVATKAARVVMSVAAEPASGSVMQIAGLSPSSTSRAASRFCASLPYCMTAEIAPMLVSTAMRPVTPQTRAISSMMTTASRKLPPAPPYSRGMV